MEVTAVHCYARELLLCCLEGSDLTSVKTTDSLMSSFRNVLKIFFVDPDTHGAGNLSGYEFIVLDPVPAKSVGVEKYYRYCKLCIFFIKVCTIGGPYSGASLIRICMSNTALDNF